MLKYETDAQVHLGINVLWGGDHPRSLSPQHHIHFQCSWFLKTKNKTWACGIHLLPDSRAVHVLSLLFPLSPNHWLYGFYEFL